MSEDKKTGPIAKIKKYFGFSSMREFKEAWDELTEEDKKELKKLINKVIID